MKKMFDKIRSFLMNLREKFKKARPPVVLDDSKANHTKIDQATKVEKKLDWFVLLSWIVTFVLVVLLLGGAMFYKSTITPAAVYAEQPTAAPTSQAVDIVQLQNSLAVPMANEGGLFSIKRKLELKTEIPEREQYDPVLYRVSSGDAMLGIAEEFKIKSETILYSNPQLEDNPHNLKPGMELKIPPMDGLYYTWKDGDTFESVAEEFSTTADAIINFPGNRVDLTDPKIENGVTILIPGGSRELRNWTLDLATSGGGSGTTNACGGGPVASGFGWPATSHAISGNGYGPGHLGIDIQANEGDPVFAAGAGIVTMAQGGWNYGYGNVVQIDHGNGYVTVYAHLSYIGVSTCTPVGQGAIIGSAGNTGNSFGAHLHFEFRNGGTNINPLGMVQ